MSKITIHIGDPIAMLLRHWEEENHIENSNSDAITKTAKKVARGRKEAFEYAIEYIDAYEREKPMRDFDEIKVEHESINKEVN
jgi:hypothetical protein